MGLLDRLAPRRSEPEPSLPANPAETDELLFATKALRKLLATLTSRDAPALIDLGPVVGSNVTFFGEHLGCKIFVEDICAGLERDLVNGVIDQLPARMAAAFPQPEASIDAVLCWDIIDYLDRPAAQALAEQLTRVLRPGGALLGFFGSSPPRDASYTKYVIADDQNLKYRPYPASRGRLATLANRDIIRLFSGLRVSDSYLMKNNVREILFRKPTYEIR